MGCSTFSEYTVVADISCAKVVSERKKPWDFWWGMIWMEVRGGFGGGGLGGAPLDCHDSFPL